MAIISGLENIAEYVDCSVETVSQLIKSGFPAGKLGKKYKAVDVDLENYIRTLYAQNEDKACHSTSEENIGGLKYKPTAKSLDNLLNAKTSEKRNKSTTK